MLIIGQNLGPYFVRACAIDIHVHMSQEASKELLYTKKTGKVPRARLRPERGRRLCTSLRNRNAYPHVTRDSRRATLYGQIGSRTRTNILCEPTQSKCMSTCHKRHQKSHFIQKLSGKMPLPKMCLERNHPFCASLRSQNACQNFTRATLYWNLQEKCLGPNWVPWSSTGLDTYRKNPSVYGRAVWGTIANHVQNFARNKFH